MFPQQSDINSGGIKNPTSQTIVPVNTQRYRLLVWDCPGKSYVLSNISNDMLVSELAEKIAQESGIPIEQRQLTLWGKKLENPDETLLSASSRYSKNSLNNETMYLLPKREILIERSYTQEESSHQELIELRTQLESINYTLFDSWQSKRTRTEIVKYINEAIDNNFAIDSVKNRLNEYLNEISQRNSESRLIEPLRRFIDPQRVLNVSNEGSERPSSANLLTQHSIFPGSESDTADAISNNENFDFLDSEQNNQNNSPKF